MAFRLGSFARGFAERAMEYKTEEENEIKELVKASYLDNLQQARENRKAVKDKREKLTNIGNELKLMGLSDAQAAGIISAGPEGAERQLALLRESAKSWGKEFDINTIVSAAEDTGITLEEAVNRTIGELKQSQEPVGLGDDRKRSIFGAGKGFEAEQFARLSKQFGEDFATIRSEAMDERVRGELPTTKIDPSKLYRPDPLEELRRREAEAQVKLRENEVARIQKDNDLSDLQAEKLRAEIDVIRKKDKDKLTDADIRATLNIVDKQLAPILIAASGSKVKWSDTTGYVTPEKASQAERALLQNAKEINAEVINLVRSGVPLDTAITHATKYIIPQYYPGTPEKSDAGTGDTETPSASRGVPRSIQDVPEADIALVDSFLATDINKPENMLKGVFFSSLRAHLEKNGVPPSTARRIANAYTEISY